MNEKTEQPTPKRLLDARRKGEVAHSKDFTQTVLVLGLFGYLIVMGGSMFESLRHLLLYPARLTDVPFREAAMLLLHAAGHTMLIICAPFVAIVLGVGVLVEGLQVGVLVSFEKIKPSGKKLNAIANLKNVFSAKNFIEFVKSMAKIAFLATLVYFVIRDSFNDLVQMPRTGIGGVTSALTQMLRALITNVAVGYSIIAAADFVWQRFHFRKSQMMTKDEVRREEKEMEGDPLIKRKRKDLHREMAMSTTLANTRKASVVVTNPTHLAVALYYDKQDQATPLPVVLAKAEGTLARQMKRVATELGIPVVQDIPLARALMASADIDQYIPSELVKPVAELLRLVRKLGHHQESL